MPLVKAAQPQPVTIPQFIVMQQLTRAEEEIMQQLWALKKAMVKEIIERLPEPKPAYNTVSTIVRILEFKGFVGHKAYGKTHEYYPLVSKDDYSNSFLTHFLGNYFGGSFEKMVSFFVKKNDVNLKEVEEMLKYLDSEDNPDQTKSDDGPQTPAA